MAVRQNTANVANMPNKSITFSMVIWFNVSKVHIAFYSPNNNIEKVPLCKDVRPWYDNDSNCMYSP